jgi:hypothetical protein
MVRLLCLSSLARHSLGHCLSSAKEDEQVSRFQL